MQEACNFNENCEQFLGKKTVLHKVARKCKSEEANEEESSSSFFFTIWKDLNSRQY